MKKLLVLGAALLSLCAVGQTARAGGDDSEDTYQRPAPRQYYEGEVAPRPCYVPRPAVFIAPPPLVFGFGRPYYRHRYYRPYGYGYGRPYGYGYAPGIHIGIGF